MVLFTTESVDSVGTGFIVVVVTYCFEDVKEAYCCIMGKLLSSALVIHVFIRGLALAQGTWEVKREGLVGGHLQVFGFNDITCHCVAMDAFHSKWHSIPFIVHYF